MQDYISTIARPQELANASNEEENVYDINDYRADYQEEHPAVYVGTYRKGDSGTGECPAWTWTESEIITQYICRMFSTKESW